MPLCTIYNSRGDKLASFSTEPYSSDIKIGRSSECHICLKGLTDTSISRVHLLLVHQAFGWKLRCLGQSGLFQNCRKIAEAELQPGSVFRFGALFFCYGVEAAPSGFDLVWSAETENKQTRALLWPGLNSIGSSRDNYCCVRTDDISRVHAYIMVTGNRVTIRSSTLQNSTYVNGDDIGEKEVEIRSHDVIQLADTPITLIKAVRLEQEAAREINVRKMPVTATARTHNQTFMYVMLAVFTILATLLVFISFRYL